MVALALLMLVASSCGGDGTQEVTGEQVLKLEPGITATEVRQLLGRPVDGGGEVTWVYRPSAGPYGKIEITFDEYEKLETFAVENR